MPEATLCTFLTGTIALQRGIAPRREVLPHLLTPASASL
jgi:hypothetical protein